MINARTLVIGFDLPSFARACMPHGTCYADRLGVLPVTPGPSGWITVERQTDQIRLHLLRHPTDAPVFWREVYVRDHIMEERFFTLAELAFSRLLFASSLSFRRFRGAYAEVLPWLVRLLGAVNDHFAQELAQRGGD